MDQMLMTFERGFLSHLRLNKNIILHFTASVGKSC